MIKSITVTNSIGESLNLELTNPWKNGVAVKSISGLGTPVYNINMMTYASGDGGAVGSVIANNRNILFEFYPMFNPQVEDSRQLLYRYFQVKKPVYIEFELDNRVSSIEGYVESNTPEIFSERETIQISVICADPYFKRSQTDAEFFYGEVPLFEFPFSNESLTEDLLVISELNLDNRATIDYTAEIDAGLLITIDCYSDPGNVTLWNIDTLGRIFIDSNRIKSITGGKLMSGDRVIISTYSGDKYVKLLREGRYYNIIGAVNKDLDWFVLKQGPNSFTYVTDVEFASIIVTFRYRDTYASI